MNGGNRVGKNDKNHPIWLYFTAEAIMMKIIGRIGITTSSNQSKVG